MFRTSSHSGPLEIELTRRNIPSAKFGGLKILDAATSRTCWRCCGSSRIRATTSPGFGCYTAARHRVCHRAACARPYGQAPTRSRCSRAYRRDRAPATTGRVSSRPWAISIFGMAGRPGAGRLWYEPHLDRIHEDAETRRADLLQLEQIASGYPSRETLPHRAHAGTPRRDERSGRRAAGRRERPDPSDDPLRQGPGVEVGLSA